jgi:hypothetical protein
MVMGRGWMVMVMRIWEHEREGLGGRDHSYALDTARYTGHDVN